jgi:hypothetical protein
LASTEKRWPPKPVSNTMRPFAEGKVLRAAKLEAERPAARRSREAATAAARR